MGETGREKKREKKGDGEKRKGDRKKYIKHTQCLKSFSMVNI